MNWRDVYSPADLGYEEDYDAPDGHCHGAQYPGAKGCGRFVPAGEYICPMCKAESDDYWREDALHEAELNAQWAIAVGALPY